MPAPVSAKGLFNSHRDKLKLEWLGGSADRVISPGTPPSGDTSLVGYLDFARPHRVQVLGVAELDYLRGLGKNSYHDALENLFASEPALIIVSDSQTPPADITARAAELDTPLCTSSLPGPKLLTHLQYYLSRLLADNLALHGVFMEVMGMGVLITGESGVGKSELALELLSRGHRLIADDMPEFSRVSPETLRGSCPALLHGFLEVRGLGILNVRAMFGDTAVKQAKNLRLIIHMVTMSEMGETDLDRISGTRRTRTLLEVDVPEILLPVAPGRNLAVLVEAAVRNHVLLMNGYDAAQDFSQRQREHLESNLK